MWNRTFTLAVLGGGFAISSYAQESTYGFSVPLTLSAGGMYTHRTQSNEPEASPVTGGFRAMLYPTLKLGSHWFAYAAVQLRLAPYFYYDAYDPDHEFYNNVLQAFVGYSFHPGTATMVVKAGRLTSAFGSFPPRYDDLDNPLLDQPLAYTWQLPLYANHLPCGVRSFVPNYGGAQSSCSAYGDQPGVTPVTLYALPGIEADFSGYRLDGRLQITSGSPASPQSLSRAGQFAQWTAGGGYTIRQGVRVGISGFRGPYLDASLASWLPIGTTLRSFPASGIGVDVQFARGRWSATGEWQRFWFDLPNFSQSPAVATGYGEVKAILTPRFYLAERIGWISSRNVASDGYSAEFMSPASSYQTAMGCWLNRYQLLKVGYEWLHSEYQSGTLGNVFGVQLVTSVHSLNWAFR
jgi:hypothetical protein